MKRLITGILLLLAGTPFLIAQDSVVTFWDNNPAMVRECYTVRINGTDSIRHGEYLSLIHI